MARVAVKQLGVSKNYLVNGNFDFWQRNTGQILVTTNRTYGADRWMLFPSTTSSNAAQIIRSTSTNVGSTYDMNFGPWSFSQKCSVAQIVEEKNITLLRGKDVTFSFKAKSSGSNPIRFQILGWTGTADVVTAFSNAVPYTNWTTYSLAANFVSIASGTGTNSNVGYTSFSCGGTVPTNVNNIICIITYAEDGGQQQYVSQVMLNEGLGAQPFSLAGGTIAQEITLCERYFQAAGRSWVNFNGNSDFCGIFRTQMRAGGTARGNNVGVGFASPISVSFSNLGIGSGLCTWTDGNFSSSNISGGVVRCTGFSGTFLSNINSSNSDYWLWDAEL